jgi:hypothetical protein
MNYLLKNIIMKKQTIFTTILFLILISVFNASAQKADLTGEWKINREKSVITDNQLLLSKITIQLKSDSILTTRVYESGDGQEYPFDEKISLDGKENKVVIYDMPRTSTATHSDSDGSIMIASTTTFNGNNGAEDMVAKETWKLDNEGKFLTLDFTNKMSGNETTGTYFYEKAK